jgi:hypothetical protein
MICSLSFGLIHKSRWYYSTKSFLKYNMFSQKLINLYHPNDNLCIYSVRMHVSCLLKSLWENLFLLRPVRLFFKKLLSVVWVDNKYSYTSDFSQNNFFRLLSHRAHKWNNKTLRFISFLKERFRPLITGEV